MSNALLYVGSNSAVITRSAVMHDEAIHKINIWDRSGHCVASMTTAGIVGMLIGE